MSLLDSILGAGNNTAQGGGLQDLIATIAQNPQLLGAITSLLGNDGSTGGLAGLISRFQQAGLGDIINSWIGSGQNRAISADQLGTALGNDTLSGLAASLGLNQPDIANQLSGILPGLVDSFTPAGELPAGGLGNTSDLAGILGSLLKA